MTYSHAQVQDNGQSVPKTEWKQTDRRTDGGDCITSVANAVGNNGRRRVARMLTGPLKLVALQREAIRQRVVDGMLLKCCIYTH